MSLFSILVDISARTAGIESGVQRATKVLEDFGETAKKVGERVLEFAGISVAFEGLKTAIEGAVERGEQLQSLSDRIGVTVEDLSRLQFVAKATSVPFEALTAAVDTYSKNVGMASDGTGRAQKAISALHIDASKLVSLPLREQLAAIADAISKVENPTKRAQYEMQLFGEQGTKLDQILRRGAEGVDELMAEADQLGVTLSSSMVAKLNEAHEAMVKMEASSEALKTQLAIGLSPAVSALALLLTKATQGAQGFGAAVAKSLYGEADPTLRLSEQLDALVKKRNNVLESIRNLQAENVAESTHAYDPAIARAKAQLAAIEAEMNRINSYIRQNQKDADAAANSANKKADVSAPDYLYAHMLDAGTRQLLDANYAYLDFYKKLDDMTQTDVEKTVAAYNEKQAALDDMLRQGLKSTEEYAKRSNAALDDALQPVQITGEKILQVTKEAHTQMEAFADQAARNIESSFANFLYDPFKDGLRGMVVSFIDAIRKMLAEAASAQILKALFGGGGTGQDASGLGGIIGKLLGSLGGGDTSGIGAAALDTSDVSTSMFSEGFSLAGALAGGGPTQAGRSYLVGENGPEIFTPGAGGYVTPNAALGGFSGDMHFHTTIDARGADADRVMTLLPPLLEQHKQQVKYEMLTAFRRSGLPAPLRA